jgi:hypothetical protein
LRKCCRLGIKTPRSSEMHEHMNSAIPNSALMPDAFRLLRCAYSAAKRER